MGYNRGRRYRILTPTNSILVFRHQSTVPSFIKFDSKLRPQERWQTDRHADIQTPAIL